MRPKFNTVSSQPDLSCAILDWRCILNFLTLTFPCAILGWRCVQSLILCLLSWTFLVQYWIEDAPQGFILISQFDLSCAMLNWRCTQSFYTVSSQSDLSCTILDWRCVPKFPSLEPFLCNTGLKMRPKFNTVSSQPDLSCAILDWRCVLKFLTWTFLVQC